MKTVQVLYKVFIKSYFRAHANQLLIFFTLFGIYFFFTPALKDSLLSFHEKIYHNLLLTISVVSEPLFAILFSIFYLIFMVSVNRHTKSLLLQPQNTFLRYSTNSESKAKQLIYWFIASTLVSSPFLVFIFFSFIVGLANSYLLIPVTLLLFVLSCILAQSLLVVRFLNNPFFNAYTASYIYLNIKRKPLWMMFLLYINNRKAQVFLVSKALSLVLIYSLYYLLNEDTDPFQLSSLISLIIGLSNSYLLFEENKFNVGYLRFYRNLPVPKFNIFIQVAFTWFLILLPEFLFCIIVSMSWAIPFSLVLLLFFRGVLVHMQQDFKRYFYIILFLFLALFLSILFKVYVVALILCFIISYPLFSKSYYTLE